MNKIFIPAMLAAVVCGACSSKASAVAVAQNEIISASDTAVVETQSGKVVGYINKGIHTYKGIPYAKAKRFCAPEAPDKWDGVRSSRAYGPTCPQGKRMGWYSDEQAFAFDWDDGYPDENCLRVNIWTPGVNDGKKRPVMVWLHGGGFSAGSGQEMPSYDGTNLAKKGDVVVVTLNHRLNALGFLDLSAYDAKYSHSGNAGLLDLVAALKWVNRNIEAFGGDPGNVTIFGQSGGGGKVSTLLATPAAKGLFHKAIVQSGSVLRTMEQKYSRKIAEQTLAELGVSPSQVSRLETIPYEQLLAAGESAIKKVEAEAEKEGVSLLMFGWAPTVDNDILPAQPFDPAAPEQSKDIPMLIGSTKHEFTASTYVPKFRNISAEDARGVLANKYGDRVDEFIAAYKKAYPDYKSQDLIDIDLLVRPSAIEQGKRKAAQKGAPVYMYLFTWESPVMDGILRSTHCMDIPFVFNNADRHSSMTGGGSDALKLADEMSSAWINFARTGNPQTDSLPTWEPYTQDSGATMIFDRKCKVVRNHDKDLMSFIREFPLRGF